MTKSLTLLFASAALTAAVALPAWSAMQAPAPGGVLSRLHTLLDAGGSERPLVLVDDDGEDDDDGGRATGRRASGDDDGEDCDDDDGSCGAAAPAAAPAGSVAPPQNGLFGSGTPKAQVK